MITRQTTIYAKYKLLMWKNILIIWRRKFQTAAEIAIPILFCLVLVYLRNLITKEPKLESVEHYDLSVYLSGYSQEAEELRALRFWQVWYAPRTPEVEQTMSYAKECMKLNRLLPFANPTRMVKEFINEEAERPLAAVIFDTTDFNENTTNKFKVTLRFAGELRDEVQDFSDKSQTVLGMNWKTDSLVPPTRLGGPRNYWKSNGGSPSGYMSQKFIILQACLSRAYIDLFVLAKNYSGGDPAMAVVVHRYTHPPTYIDSLLEVFRLVVPMLLFMSYLYPCVNNIEMIVAEKESQLRETMKIMGVPSWLNWSAWFTKIMFNLTATATLQTILLCLPCSADGETAVFWRSGAAPIWSFFLAYSLACATFCLMLSSVFSTSAMCNTMTALIWFVFFVPFTLVDRREEDMPMVAKNLFCLFHNSALGLGLRTILKHEANGRGLQWFNYFVSPDAGIENSMNLGYIVVMLLTASLLYLIIALYLDQVNPGNFGLARPWYFPFLFCCPRRDRGPLDIPKPNPIMNKFIETVRDAEVGLEMQKIIKAYKRGVIVLNGVDLKLNKDEITVILGENGAGKTTLMSILSGVISPTSGDMFLNGQNISGHIQAVQQSLGFCPQQNILFDQLTVREHIIFFALMKGFPLRQVDKEVKRYVSRLGLVDKTDAEVATLSGGMKRKVSLAVALCGGSEIVFCDEPTSGIDPMARRMIWDLLRQEKHNRTILLSTHFMDEADVLADRVAILADGRIKSYGSPLYLKNAYHTGYILHCEKGAKCDEKRVQQLLSKHIPGIQPFNNVATELTFKLDAEHADKYEIILKDMENNAASLGVLGLGISQSTLEEIFLFVTNPTTFQENARKPLDIHRLGRPKQNKRTCSLYMSQIGAMFIKRFLVNLRRYNVWLAQIIVPSLMMGLFATVARLELPLLTLPALPMTLEPYADMKPVVIVSDNTDATDRMGRDILRQYKQMITDQGAEVMEVLDVNKYIEALPLNSMVGFNKRHIFGVRVEKGKLSALFNNEYYHTMPLSLNYLYNAYAKALNKHYEISVTNFPFPVSSSSKFDLLATGMNMGFQLVSALGFATAFMSSFYITICVKERVSRFKLLQLVSGVNLFIYWITTFIFDYLTFTCIVGMLLATLFLLDEDGFNTLNEVLRIGLVYACFIWAVLPWIYVASMLFDSPASGFLCVFQVAILFGNSMHYMLLALRSPAYDMPDKADLFTRVFYIVPFFTVINALNNINNLNNYIPMCTSICDSHPICTKPVLVCYTGRQFSEKCCVLDFFAWEDPGISWDIAVLLASGLIAFILLFAIEYKILSRLLLGQEYKDKEVPKDDRKTMDLDVWTEKERVRKLTKGKIMQYGLVAKDLCKYYREDYAVKRLCLTVSHNECFGLLGVNGAGKTTTFRMMAGDLRISSGNVWVRGYSVQTNLPSAYENIGYCPQFDALFGELTGRETMTLFLMMCGTPMREIMNVVMHLAKELNFVRHLDKQVSAYSGGNKRKLSTALAIMGGPALIYLDEPTTGMDPGAKRHLWGVLSKYQAAGKSIVLTSHSMEECEALCTRLAIMVNGQFQCIGSTQHLKNKFSKGFTINVLLLSSFRNAVAEGKVVTYLKRYFPRVVLKEARQGMLTMFVPFTEATWSKLFGVLEKAKRELKVETYSLSQTTLEQIFLSFTKLQEDV